MFYLALRDNFTVVYLESNAFYYLFIELTIAFLYANGCSWDFISLSGHNGCKYLIQASISGLTPFLLQEQNH